MGVCAVGISCADSARITGELLKGFKKKRPLSAELCEKLGDLGEKLQCSLPAIDLTAQAGIISAVANDLGGECVYAQQVLGLGRPGDILLGLSTSGNAENVYNACLAAKALGLTVIGMTGKSGGRLKEICDILLCVPETETAAVQELHLPLYYYICASVEAAFFRE